MQSNLKLFIIKVCVCGERMRRSVGRGRGDGAVGREEERENTNTEKPFQSVNLAKKYKDVVTPGTGNVTRW